MSRTKLWRTKGWSNRYELTLEQSNVLCWRKILLSDGIKPKRRLQWGRNNVGIEYDLVNDLSFNLCIIPQSPVMRWLRISEWREVIREEVLKKVN